MKHTLISLAGLFPAIFVVPVFAQGIGEPVLTTPGTATWATELTTSGSRTVFTITGNTVLDWGQFNLSGGNELVFDFVGGETVSNMLGSGGANIIAGNISSNGNLAFFSPGADLIVTGNVIGKSVTLATMQPDPSGGSGGVVTLQGGAGGNLRLTGSVQATGGDVLLAGDSTQVFSGARVTAAGAVLMAAGSKVTVDPGRSGAKLGAEGGAGFLLHMGETRAARIEVAASREIQNGGRLDVGSKSQRIFLEIGSGGKISQNRSAIVVGDLTINGKAAFNRQEVQPDDAGGGHEADAAAALSESSLRMPRLKNTDGSTASKSKIIVTSAPTSGSTDGGRDRHNQSSQVAKQDKSKPIFRGSSFFGMRGGKAVEKR
jgi:hypothetical protein